MRKFVLAIDSFKGSLTSTEAEAAAREGILRVYPRAETLCIPIADGGEGMLDALSTLGGQEVPLRVQGPLNDKVEARYLITADGQTAYIEMASASGLTLVPENLRNPLQTTTRGTGELMRDALDRGCRRLVIGLGGSATNDGGMGMLSTLGIRFLDRQGKELEGRGKDMTATVRIDTSLAHPALKTARCTAACDVRNPFDGPQGAAFIFAPQKGATPDDVQLLDQGLHHLAQLYRQTTGLDIATLPGAGAAGGLGGALAAFLHADLRPGISLLLEANGFQDKIKGGRSDHYRRGTCRPTDPDGKSSGRSTARSCTGRHPHCSDSRTNCRRRRTTCCRILPCTRHYPSRHATPRSHAKAYSPREYPPGNGAAFKKLE